MSAVFISKMSLQRTAVITGGQGGLATALVQALQLDGWMVLAPGRSELDVTRADQVSAWFAAVGQVQLLVCNAGLVDDALMSGLRDEQWDKVLAVNLTGAFLCARAVLPQMVQQGLGHIVTIGSYSGLTGPVGQGHYAAAKAGLVGLTKSIAKEYGHAGVRCNCVLPGFLETKMTSSVKPARRAEVLTQHALGRFNTVEDAARFIVQLEAMTAVSGQVFQLDSRC
jgi:3-oxoacyl-[acyl-carrier protein] reductase